jgi:hypothetical protein
VCPTACRAHGLHRICFQTHAELTANVQGHRCLWVHRSVRRQAHQVDRSGRRCSPLPVVCLCIHMEKCDAPFTQRLPMAAMSNHADRCSRTSHQRGSCRANGRLSASKLSKAAWTSGKSHRSRLQPRKVPSTALMLGLHSGCACLGFVELRRFPDGQVVRLGSATGPDEISRGSAPIRSAI